MKTPKKPIVIALCILSLMVSNTQTSASNLISLSTHIGGLTAEMTNAILNQRGSLTVAEIAHAKRSIEREYEILRMAYGAAAN